MTSPFQKISDVFRPRYNVNFSIEKPDGSILLTLTGAEGVASLEIAIQCLNSPAQPAPSRATKPAVVGVPRRVAG